MIKKKYLFISLFVLILILILVVFYDHIAAVYDILSDRENIKSSIESYGSKAPLVFIFFQVLQVVFAPVPGEATGIIGGYLFGGFYGFIYSTLGLTVGSWLNFILGRFLGRDLVKKLTSVENFVKFDKLIKKKGVSVLLILFLLPGFPKDYLCLFLGVSTIPLKRLLILALVGRLPGTYILSCQGAALFEKNYLLTYVLLILCLIIIFIVVRYKKQIDRYLEE